MTRPIYEPTVPRDIQNIGFSTRQDFRRPNTASASAGSQFASFAQIEVSATVSPSTTTALTDLDDEFYVLIDQVDVEVNQRVSDDAWGILINTPGMYYIWADVRTASGAANPIRCEFGDISGDIAPGTLDAGKSTTFIQTTGVDPVNGDLIVHMGWLTLVKPDNGGWGDLAGGHECPIRVAVFVRHTEAGDILVSADLNVGLVHRLDEVC